MLKIFIFLIITLCGDAVEWIKLQNGYQVWTNRVGEGPIQILTLHGGPGGTHEYLESLQDHFPKEQYQIIFYDQLGSYYSDQPDDPSLWTLERFCEEVEEVRSALGLEQFYLYGHSWGALLAIEYALKYPSHLKGLILSSAIGSMASYEDHIQKIRQKLPKEVQERLAYFEKQEDFSNPEYEKILFKEIYRYYICRLNPWPEALFRMYHHMNKQVYNQMQGPNEFVVTGNCKTWNRWKDLHQIQTPTLILAGCYDTVNPEDCKKMGALMPHATVKICEKGSHCTFFDDPENYFFAIQEFLSKTKGI